MLLQKFESCKTKTDREKWTDFTGYAKLQSNNTYSPVLIIKRQGKLIYYLDTRGKILFESDSTNFEKIIDGKLVKNDHKVEIKTLPFQVGMFVCLNVSSTCQNFFCNCYQQQGSYGIIEEIYENDICVRLIDKLDVFYKCNSEALLSEYMKDENCIDENDDEISSFYINHPDKKLTVVSENNIKPSYDNICDFKEIFDYFSYFEEAVHNGETYIIPNLDSLLKKNIKEENLVNKMIQNQILQTW